MGVRTCAHRGAQRGQVLPIVALLAALLMGIVAMAIDAGRGYIDRRSLQAAADASALAGNEWLSMKEAYTPPFDLTCAEAAAIQEAVTNLPGTAVPTGVDVSTHDAGGGGCLVPAGIYPATPAGTSVNLKNGYSLEIVTAPNGVRVTLHHSLALTFGVVVAHVASITPTATATAVNNHASFAMALFKNNTITASLGAADADLGINGNTAELDVSLATGATGTADVFSNESLCPSSSSANSGHVNLMTPAASGGAFTGNMYAWAAPGSGLPGNCGNDTGSANGYDVNPVNGLTLAAGTANVVKAPFQLFIPGIDEPPPSSCTGKPNCGGTVTVKANTTQCIAAGIYQTIDVKNGATAILLPGVFKITGPATGNGGFLLGNGATGREWKSGDSGSGCPGSPLTGDLGVAIDIVPTGNNGASDQLSVSGTGGGSPATLNITAPTAAADHGMAVYVEPGLPDPCQWSTNGSCGSSVINLAAGSSYSINGTLYGYGDNMVFGGGATPNGIGQVLAWTVKLAGNGVLRQTYTPGPGPGIKGLLS